MHVPLYFRTMLTMAILVVTAYVNGSLASDNANPTVYQVVIDGKPYQLKDGREEQVILRDGKEIRIEVSVNAKQPYRTSELQFEYDAGLSLDDDKAATERTILLVHATGCGIVISEQGGASDIDQPQLLKNMVEGILDRAKRGVANNISKRPIETAEFSHAKGIATASTHLDEDNDKITHYYYILQCGNRVVGVIGFHDQDGGTVYSRIQKTVLESLQERKQRANKPDAGDAK